MPDIYFTSDTHWGHENIIKFCNRPFSSVKEMNEALLSNWNETVKQNDVVYHLGDVAMGHFEDSWSYVKKLHGMINLCIGNHDRVAERYHMPRKYIAKYGALYAERFASISYEYKRGDWKLHHFPYEGDHVGEERFKEFRPIKGNESVLIHGHVHELWKHNGNQINVGVDARNYRPVHIDELQTEVQAITEAS